MASSAPSNSTTEHKARIVADYILAQFRLLRDGESGSAAEHERRPLMVSMQGPQGAGKSTLAEALVKTLASESYGLKAYVSSLDDFYLTHQGLRALADASPKNALLAGRGPPGTHDISLLSNTLERIKRLNTGSETSAVQLPIFDKSLHGGQGDRSTRTLPIEGPVDVFILEGWSLGYSAIEAGTLEQRWKRGRTASAHPWETVEEINSNLAKFQSTIHPYFDAHVAIQPSSFDHVYRWRLQQEHHMKSLNGGQGMSDEEVERFVDRYMPVYECYAEDSHAAPSLTMYFGPDREVEKVEQL